MLLVSIHKVLIINWICKKINEQKICKKLQSEFLHVQQGRQGNRKCYNYIVAASIFGGDLMLFVVVSLHNMVQQVCYDALYRSYNQLWSLPYFIVDGCVYLYIYLYYNSNLLFVGGVTVNLIPLTLTSQIHQCYIDTSNKTNHKV